jgi:hypothetical protein
VGDPDTWLGRRDHVLLVLMIQTDVRVSELVGLRVCDIHLGTGPPHADPALKEQAIAEQGAGVLEATASSTLLMVVATLLSAACWPLGVRRDVRRPCFGGEPRWRWSRRLRRWR